VVTFYATIGMAGAVVCVPHTRRQFSNERNGFPTGPGATDAGQEVALRSEHGGRISNPPPIQRILPLKIFSLQVTCS